MENKLQIFSNPEFGNVRTIEENGKVLFCANDVARALGYSNTRDAIIRHCRGVVKRDGVSLTTNQHGVTTEQATDMNFIPEGDVYRLIIRSKLPAAEKFERWVFDEVVPTIVHTGSYGAGTFDMQMLTAIITQTATAVAAEIVKQLAPLLAQRPAQPAVTEMFDDCVYTANTCKMERAPKELREQVDARLHQMIEEQAINLSAIVRFCAFNGFAISLPSVKTYFDRNFRA